LPGLIAIGARSVLRPSTIAGRTWETREDFILPDRNTADRSSASLLAGFLSDGTTVHRDSNSVEAQSPLFAECSAALNSRHPNDIGHDNRDRRNLQRPGRREVDRRTGIKTFHHTLEHPIAAEDLCTWLDLLMDFAGSDLLWLKAIVSVAGWPGPVLLHGAQKVFCAPLTLTQWPTGDHRTRIALVTRNLNEDCLRELLAIFALGSKSPQSRLSRGDSATQAADAEAAWLVK
jgi:G3E family GTPase